MAERESDGDEGSDFLGFHHRMVASWKCKGRYFLNKWPSPRAMASIRAKIRDRTPRGYAGRDLAVVVAELNPVLRGWGRTTATATRRGSSTQVHLRVAQRPRHLPADRDGPLLGCACLTVNGVGEPGAGEPHARFDRGPLARLPGAEEAP